MAISREREALDGVITVVQGWLNDSSGSDREAIESISVIVNTYREERNEENNF